MTAYSALKSRIDQGDIIVLDGATGTELQRRGAPMDPAAWCGPATLENDHILTAIHRDYIEAGSDVVTANTFAASKIMLKAAGLADRSDEIVTRAVEAALKAREISGNAQVVIAGSLSHMVPVAEGTAKVDPSKIPSPAEISDAFHALAHGLKRAGAELILLEMMYEPKRTKLAVDAALSTGLPVWFGISARRGADGQVKAFHHLEDLPIADIIKLIPSQGIDAVGVMHTGAEVISDTLIEIKKHYSGPLAAYPDSGYFEMPDWKFVDIIPPDRYGHFVRQWLNEGAQMIGGCCGLGLDHIVEAKRAADERRATL
ncbi:MAG: homocysteine S-methyltransferase family protein [Hyphomicrobiales bacterium]